MDILNPKTAGSWLIRIKKPYLLQLRDQMVEIKKKTLAPVFVYICKKEEITINPVIEK